MLLVLVEGKELVDIGGDTKESDYEQEGGSGEEPADPVLMGTEACFQMIR